jgi:hypothetical protein
MSQGAQGSPVAQLAEHMTDEDFRNAFASDHQQALEKKGIDVSDVPSGVLEALKDCSVDELRALSKVRNALIDAGVPDEYKAEMV